MKKRAGLLMIIYGLAQIVSGAWAQEPQAQQEEEEAPVPVLAREEGEKVVLSPWRVGDVRMEERKRVIEERRARVLRETETKRREASRRKERIQEESERKKKDGDQFFPTDY